jgi:hypothetical protein
MKYVEKEGDYVKKLYTWEFCIAVMFILTNILWIFFDLPMHLLQPLGSFQPLYISTLQQVMNTL